MIGTIERYLDEAAARSAIALLLAESRSSAIVYGVVGPCKTDLVQYTMNVTRSIEPNHLASCKRTVLASQTKRRQGADERARAFAMTL